MRRALGTLGLCLCLCLGRAATTNDKVLYRLGERHGGPGPAATDFPGAEYNIADLFTGLFTEGNATRLGFGGVLYRRQSEPTAPAAADLQKFLNAELGRRRKDPGGEVVIETALHFDALLCMDFFGNADHHRPFAIEIGVYDRSTRKFESKYWRETVIGKVIAVKIKSSERTHHCLVNVDLAGTMSLLMNTWETTVPTDVTDSTFKVVTYNLWHTNPAHWAMPDSKTRWTRYTDRINLFAEVLSRADADVILLQEVRIDTSFHGPRQPSSPPGSGNQLQHLLDALAIHSKTEWQYCFQPASNMIDKNNFQGSQLAEGVAILSKHPFILPSLQVLLLPRILSESSDDHTRIVLRGLVKVAGAGGDLQQFDVMTTHFSLSSLSRERAVDYLSRRLTPHPTSAQIFGGDFNAEPGELAMTLLTDQVEFRDSWALLHQPPRDDDDDLGLTFPACRPVKRIDYLFVRNSTTRGGGSVVAKEVGVIGMLAKEELAAGNAIALPEFVGMLDPESLLWASDHFGLELSVQVTRQEKKEKRDDERRDERNDEL